MPTRQEVDGAQQADHRSDPSDVSLCEPKPFEWRTVRRLGTSRWRPRTRSPKMRQQAQLYMLSTSVPVALGPHMITQTYGGKKPMKIAGIPVPGHQSRPPVPTTPEPKGRTSCAKSSRSGCLGAKMITSGRKNTGQSYVITYEQDHGYVKYVDLQRVRPLHEDIEDFAN